MVSTLYFSQVEEKGEDTVDAIFESKIKGGDPQRLWPECLSFISLFWQKDKKNVQGNCSSHTKHVKRR